MDCSRCGDRARPVREVEVGGVAKIEVACRSCGWYRVDADDVESESSR